MDIFDFPFLCATLKAYPARSTCRMDMVDNAFERVGYDVYDYVMLGW